MYSVFRMMSATADPDLLKVIKEKMNSIRPDVCSSRRNAHEGFTCSISYDRLWSRQQREILQFLDEFSAAFEELPNVGIMARIDVAVNAEDWSERAWAMFLVTEPELMGALSRLGISLEFSFYGQRRVISDRNKYRSARRSP